MKKYFISHTYGKEHEDNINLYYKIQEYGKCLKSRWSGDYIVGTYEYNNKNYELWYNAELGVSSEVIEYAKEEL